MPSKKKTQKRDQDHKPSQERKIPQEKVNTWVSQAREGDREAYDHLVLMYQDRLYHTILGIVKKEEDALDLVQEAFVRAFYKLKSFEGHSSFYTWLFRIAINLAFSFMRKDQKHHILSLKQLQPSEDQPWETEEHREKEPSSYMEDREKAQKIEKALGELAEEFRIPLVLKEFEGLKYEAIGEILQIPKGTVKSRIFRAREALKEKLKDLL